ncbi:hypothetical protein NXS19_008752 [Fusarium pseudograminearum]|nr:hypothetical protein NXS19_008752 [Fusarium pseudograminearum]
MNWLKSITKSLVINRLEVSASSRNLRCRSHTRFRGAIHSPSPPKKNYDSHCMHQGSQNSASHIFLTITVSQVLIPQSRLTLSGRLDAHAPLLGSIIDLQVQHSFSRKDQY